jgi:hypothetical protein
MLRCDERYLVEEDSRSYTKTDVHSPVQSWCHDRRAPVQCPHHDCRLPADARGAILPYVLPLWAVRLIDAPLMGQWVTHMPG